MLPADHDKHFAFDFYGLIPYTFHIGYNGNSKRIR
jgi:hypothetical protein